MSLKVQILTIEIERIDWARWKYSQALIAKDRRAQGRIMLAMVKHATNIMTLVRELESEHLQAALRESVKGPKEVA